MGKELRMSMVILYFTPKNYVAFYDKLAYKYIIQNGTESQIRNADKEIIIWCLMQNLSYAITHAHNIIKEGYENFPTI